MQPTCRPATYPYALVLLGAVLVSCSSSSHPTGGDAAADVPHASPPASCDDQNDCTEDSVDPHSNQCLHVPKADESACEDGQACTLQDRCQGGLCFSGPYKRCQALDSCHVPGACSPATGECTHPPAANTVACDDGKACTLGDRCSDGLCTGTALVCSGVATCDPSDGICKDGSGLAFPAATQGRVLGHLQFAGDASNGNCFATDRVGNLFLGGTFGGTLDLGTGPLQSESLEDKDFWVAAMDATSGQTRWARAYHGQGSQQMVSIAANARGQLAWVGDLEGTMMVKDQELVKVRPGDTYILAASASKGDLLWSRTANLSPVAKSTANGHLRGISGDPNGSAFFVCGVVSQKAAMDLDASLPWHGGTDIVLAALDGDTGKTLWAKQIGGINNEDCQAIAVDEDSNIYLTGTYVFGSTLGFGSSIRLPEVDALGSNWTFVAKFTRLGEPLWATAVAGASGQKATVVPLTLAPSPNGILLAGRYQGTPSLAGFSLGAQSGAFIVHLGAQNGQPSWLAQFDKQVQMKGISLTSDGSALVVGSYMGTDIMIGQTPMPSLAGLKSGSFVAKLHSSTGLVLSARGYGSPIEGNTFFGISAARFASGSERDTSLLFGTFQDRIDLGKPLSILSAPPSTVLGESMGFLAKLVP